MGLESALKGLAGNLPKSNGGGRSVDAMVSPKTKKLLHLGNYGLMVNPIELDANIVDWIDNQLVTKIQEHNINGWAIEKLKVLSNMLKNRNQEFFAEELKTIAEKLNRVG